MENRLNGLHCIIPFPVRHSMSPHSTVVYPGSVGSKLPNQSPYFVAGASYGQHAAVAAAAAGPSDLALTPEESKPAYAQKRAEQSKRAEYEQRQSQRVRIKAPSLNTYGVST